MNRAVLQPAAAGQPQNTPTRGRGEPERKRDDAQRSNSRAIIGAGSGKNRSAIPDSDLPVIDSQGVCSLCQSSMVCQYGRPVPFCALTESEQSD